MAYLVRVSLRETRFASGFIEILIETTPLIEECLQTARRVLGDEHELTVIGNRILREHGGNIAKAKAKRLIERFISRFKAQRRARLRAT